MPGMKVKDASILIVPGYTNSGPDHWQSRWQARLSTARRVEQAEWSKPVRDDWTAAMAAAVNQADRPVVIVAHSLGVATAVQALPLFRQPVAGAFLVAPADVESAASWPIVDGTLWPESGLGFAPVPLQPLPFSSMLLASSDDPYCRLQRARHFAAAWESEFVEVGPAGHINAESGHGPWPDGVLRFGRFLAGLRP